MHTLFVFSDPSAISDSKNINDAWSSCGPCPWGETTKSSNAQYKAKRSPFIGSRNVDGYRCLPCQQSLRHYDYLYLIFHALMPLFINGVFIKVSTGVVDTRRSARHRVYVKYFLYCLWFGSVFGVFRPTVWCVIQLACATLEATLALLTAIFVFPPFGQLQIYSCRRSRLHEWYSTFHHPQINATHTLRCT